MTDSSTSSKATTWHSESSTTPTCANNARLFVNHRRVVESILTPSTVIIAITAITPMEQIPSASDGISERR